MEMPRARVRSSHRRIRMEQWGFPWTRHEMHLCPLPGLTIPLMPPSLIPQNHKEFHPPGRWGSPKPMVDFHGGRNLGGGFSNLLLLEHFFVLSGHLHSHMPLIFDEAQGRIARLRGHHLLPSFEAIKIEMTMFCESSLIIYFLFSLVFYIYGFVVVKVV